MKQTDEKVLSMLSQIEKAEQDIKETKKPTWKTRCIATINGTQINFHTLDKNGVINTTKSLLNLKKENTEALEFLELEVEEVVINGEPIDNWLADLRSRLTVISLDEKKKALAKLKKDVGSKLSEEKSTEMEVDNLGAELDNLLK